jgi:hypothetical protein
MPSPAHQQVATIAVPCFQEAKSHDSYNKTSVNLILYKEVQQHFKETMNMSRFSDFSETIPLHEVANSPSNSIEYFCLVSSVLLVQ